MRTSEHRAALRIPKYLKIASCFALVVLDASVALLNHRVNYLAFNVLARKHAYSLDRSDLADYTSYDKAASKTDCRKRQKGDLSNHECVATQAKPVTFACSSSILQSRDCQYIPEDKQPTV